MSSSRYEPCVRSLGAPAVSKIHSSRILVVGAGGIGCELLKNLALMGFLNIEIIDLDTIDVSNLNRQFLFRPEHVGKPKAIVAAEAARQFNPSINIKPHHGNVKSEEFGLEYISSFDLVLNALDNVDARRHVNRLCLAAQIPLIDSGTTGYNGQVMPIIKQKTACYECSPKPSPKVYPICTIRSTPDKPVHCIVWAKECFKLLFGNTKESMLWEDTATGETSCYMGLLEFPKSITPQSIVSYGATIIEALYIHEINKRIASDVYKTAKKVPQPLTMEEITAGSELALSYLQSTLLSSASSLSSSSSSSSSSATKSKAAKPSSGSGWDMRSWTSVESIAEFIICIWEAWHPSGGESNGDLIGSLAFDKDDNMAMKFVSASSNLRSSIFDIPTQSFHDAKGIAGNIIPAIATTNAIVASVQVMHAIKILASQASIKSSMSSSSKSNGDGNSDFPFLPHTYCRRKPTGKGVYLMPSSADPPNLSCYVCNKNQLTLQVDTSKYTYGDLINKVVKGKLGFNQPTIIMGSSIIYEEGEDADEDFQSKFGLTLDKAPAGGVVEGRILSCNDYTQKLELSIIIKHVPDSTFDSMEDEDVAKADNFIISGEITKVAADDSDDDMISAPHSNSIRGSASAAGSSVSLNLGSSSVSSVAGGKRSLASGDPSVDPDSMQVSSAADGEVEDTNPSKKPVILSLSHDDGIIDLL